MGGKKSKWAATSSNPASSLPNKGGPLFSILVNGSGHFNHKPMNTCNEEQLMDPENRPVANCIKRLSWVGGAIGGIYAILSVGCAMCCGPFDYDYPTFGGKYDRYDRSYGRLGSVFSDPMAAPTGGSADSNLQGSELDNRRKIERDERDPDELRRRLEQELEERRRVRPSTDLLPGPDETTEAGIPARWSRLRNR
jgi:hypothetical protein